MQFTHKLQIMKNKKIYFDMFLNICAAGVPIVALQLVIYPLLSRELHEDVYGQMIAMYALIILISDSLGKSINNIRLINNNEAENKQGDFNLITAIFVVIAIVVITPGLIYYNRTGSAHTSTIAILVFTSVLFLINSYINVYFRIRLNYTAILINSVFQTSGFLLGFVLYKAFGNWGLIFFLAQFASFAYLAKKTDLLKEPIKRTSRFKNLLTDSTLLSASMFLSQGMAQADKLLLFPLLGGATVSIYYTATLMGKIIVLATGPINSVILSYIADRDQLSRKTFKNYLGVCILACGVCGVIILFISRPVLGLLFPKFVDSAMEIVPLTTLNIFLWSLAGMITPIVMKYCDIYWQIVINAVGFVLYVLFAVVFLNFFGIMGFCLGIGISYFLRIVMMLYIYLKDTRQTP